MGGKPPKRKERVRLENLNPVAGYLIECDQNHWWCCEFALQHRWTECIANFDWLSKNELIKTKWLCKCNCAILSKSEIPLSHIEFLTGTNDTFQIKYRGIHSKFKNRHSLQLNSLTFIPISDESKLVTHCQWVTHVRAHTHTHSGSWLHIILDIDWLWQRTEVIHLPYSFSIDN